jgi:hypothetical protein
MMHVRLAGMSTWRLADHIAHGVSDIQQAANRQTPTYMLKVSEYHTERPVVTLAFDPAAGLQIQTAATSS